MTLRNTDRSATTSRERGWVETVKAELESVLKAQRISIHTGYRLPYAMHVSSYRQQGGERIVADPVTRSYGYQTDLLVAETLDGTSNWVPRVVVEFKFGKVSTHDVLTYSAKAATHKNVHPYLRYGVVIGAYAGQVPVRLIRHGQHFDFMVTLESEQLAGSDRDRLVDLLQDEVRASQTISRLMSEKSDIWLLHRRLEVKS